MAPEIESQSDPILEYHYRGHKAPVLCSAFNPNQKQVRLPFFISYIDPTSHWIEVSGRLKRNRYRHVLDHPMRP